MTLEFDAKARRSLERQVKKAREISSKISSMEVAYSAFEHLVIVRFLASNGMTIHLEKGNQIHWILARRQTRGQRGGLRASC